MKNYTSEDYENPTTEIRLPGNAIADVRGNYFVFKMPEEGKLAGTEGEFAGYTYEVPVENISKDDGFDDKYIIRLSHKDDVTLTNKYTHGKIGIRFDMFRSEVEGAGKEKYIDCDDNGRGKK